MWWRSFEKISENVKDRVGADLKVNTDLVMLFHTKITSTSSTLGIGIPDIFMNMLSCQGFINNNDSIVILKFPNRISQYYFNKGFTQLKFDEDHLKKIPN